MSEPSPLGEVAEGYVGLARWFTTLLGEQAVTVGRQIDNGTFDANAAASSYARAASLPLLGWAAAVNELGDAAAIFRGLQRERDLESDVFEAPQRGQPRVLSLDGLLTNGYGLTLAPGEEMDARFQIPAALVEIVPSTLTVGESNFRLRATALPPDRVGVYSGTVTVAAPGPDGVSERVGDVAVWLVVS